LAFVQLDEGENLENALRRFKRKVQQEAIIKEIKKHSVYFTPGEAPHDGGPGPQEDAPAHQKRA